MNNSTNKIFLLIIILILLIIYFPIINLYFQQDEWHNFGWIIFNSNQYGKFGFFKQALSHYQPLYLIINYLNYSIFGLNNLIPSILVLFLIVFNSFFWYKNVYLLSKNIYISIGSLFFGYTALISQQAITWVIPAVAFQSSLLFMNLSIYNLLNYISASNLRNLLLCIFFALIGIFFKYNIVFLIIFLPIFYWVMMMVKSIKFKLTLKTICVLALIAFLMLASVLAVIHVTGFRISVNKTQFLSNLIILPTKSIIQIIFPYHNIYYWFISKFLVNRYQIFLSKEIIETFITELLAVNISLLLIGFGYIFLIKNINIIKKYKILIYFSLLLYFLSFLPYSVDKYSTGTGFLESRYYYIAVFPLGILLSLFIYVIIITFQKYKNIVIRNILYFVVYLLITINFGVSIFNIRENLYQSVKTTNKRLEILNFANKLVIPKINKNIILYIEDINQNRLDEQNFTGKLFQTGFLYPFLVYSYNSGKIPYEVFKDDILWQMSFQGVNKWSGKIIGIFYDYNQLKKCVFVRKCNIDDIYAFTFNYSNSSSYFGSKIINTIQKVDYYDNTEQIRRKLQ